MGGWLALFTFVAVVNVLSLVLFTLVVRDVRRMGRYLPLTTPPPHNSTYEPVAKSSPPSRPRTRRTRKPVQQVHLDRTGLMGRTVIERSR